MKRQDALDYIRIAGFHNDKRSFTRLYIENRVSLKRANEAWVVGQKQKIVGIKCECAQCR